MQRSVTRLGVGIHQDKLFARPWRSLRLCEKSVLCSSHGLLVEAGNQISRKGAKIAKSPPSNSKESFGGLTEENCSSAPRMAD